MEYFFTVDRRALCKKGSTLELYPKLDSNPVFPLVSKQSDEEIRKQLSLLFNEGLSPHGVQYLLGAAQYSNGMMPISSVVEIVWELIRLKDYPECPSRFQSYFGVKTIKEANSFRTTANAQSCSVYKVQCEKSFKADMSLLNMGGSLISASSLANKYWSQEISSNPIIEYLLIPDIKVIEKVA